MVAIQMFIQYYDEDLTHFKKEIETNFLVAELPYKYPLSVRMYVRLP